MSYNIYEDSDGLKEMFKRETDCLMCLKNMEEERGHKRNFVAWLGKAVEINKRTVYLYFKNNKRKYSENNLRIVKAYLGEEYGEL